MTPALRLALPGAIILAVWSVVALLTPLSPASFLVGLAGLLVGAALGAAASRLRWPATLRSTPSRPAASAPSPHGAPGDAGGDPVPPALESLRALLGAHRLVLWWVRRDDGVVVAAASTGAMPTPRPVAGEPISWCAEEAQPLRIDPLPGWADAPVLAVPVPVGDGLAVLTVEAQGLEAALQAELQAAGILASVLDLHASHRQRIADLDHVHRVLRFLRDPPRAGDPSAFPDALARTAVEAAGAAGALVASWDDDDPERGGLVLARYGRGKGPEPGMAIAPGDSDLALAVRAGATLHRDGRDGTRPLAEARERWSGRPRHTTIIPLLDPSGRCGALLALWGDEPVEAGVVALLESLGPVLVLQLGHSRDLVRIRDRADRDALTGLPNRAAFDERLELEARRFHRYRRPLALLVLDLDHFKAVNDTFGHPVGDAVLQRVADLLRANTRDPDIPARYGGEEMVVVLPETMLRPALDVAERIRTAVEASRFEHDGRPIDLTVSIGVSACPECVADPGDLLRTADEALYQAKRDGRNRVATAPLVAAGS
jgi:diguanylate cyclase (GGDEF)-like protein